MSDFASLIEHTAWIGPEYCDGQRLALVGWSHWRNEEEPDVATKGCIEHVIAGTPGWRKAFFTQVRNYFGYADHERFWPRVMFFNFLPACVGNGNQRYGHNTPEQREAGAQRFLGLLKEHKPQKVFVFTSRHWAFPPPVDGCRPLTNSSKFKVGHYRFGDDMARAYFLRHPQGANRETMQGAITLALGDAVPTADACRRSIADAVSG